MPEVQYVRLNINPSEKKDAWKEGEEWVIAMNINTSGHSGRQKRGHMKKKDLLKLLFNTHPFSPYLMFTPDQEKLVHSKIEERRKNDIKEKE